MFKNLPASAGGKRQASLPAMILSGVLHAGVLGGVLYASANAEAYVREKEEEQLTMMEVEPEPEPTKPEPPPPPPPPPPPDAPAPPPIVKGTQTLVPPLEPPKGVQEEDANAKAVNPEDFSGQGKEGGVAKGADEGVQRAQVAKVDSTPPPAPEYYTAETVSEQANLSDSQRRAFGNLLQRNYPGLLRDAGVQGQTRVRFVVNEDGNVDMSSVEIVEASHEQFGDATKKVLDRVKFKPAKVGNQKVRQLVELPISWTIAR